MMTKLVTILFATTLAMGMNVSIAQNVKSDQDKAQGQEQQMQEKEKRATTGGQQSAPNERERARTEDSRSAPTAGDAATDCKGMTGRAKEQCMKKGAPATGQTDSDTTQRREDNKQKQQ